MKKESQQVSNKQIFEQCSNFFQGINKDLEQIVFDSRLQQRKIHHNKKMNIIDQKSKPNVKKAIQYRTASIYKQQKAPSYQCFVANVVIDFLRSRNYNYCYNIFMRESNTISEQIISKGKIAQMIGVKQEHDLCVGNQVSLIELLIEKVCSFKKDYETKSIQTIDTSISVSLQNTVLFENRINQMRQQTEERQKRHYEKVIKSLKNKQMLELRQQIAKQYDQKIKKFKQQFNKIHTQHQQKNNLTGKSFNYQKTIKQVQILKLQIQKLERQNYTLKDQLKVVQKQQIGHVCSQSSQFKQMQMKIIQQRKYLQKKTKQYQLALRNMGTKVEDFCKQKQIVYRQGKATDNFVQQQKKLKQNKNYMIEQIHGQLKKMQIRIQNISEDNSKLRQQNRQLNQKIKEMTELSKARGTSQHTSSLYSQLNNMTSLKNVLVGVSQEEISAQLNGKQGLKRMDCSDLSQTSEQMIQNIEKKYQHEEKVSKIFSDMKLLKNKVRFLVEDFKAN